MSIEPVDMALSGGTNEQRLVGLVLCYDKERTGGLASQLDLLSWKCVVTLNYLIKIATLSYCMQLRNSWFFDHLAEQVAKKI